MALTDLTAYLTSTNNAGSLPTARDMQIAAPAAPATATTKTGQSTGYGEICAQGLGTAWPAATTAPAPSGKGFILDTTTLEGKRIGVGLWRPTITLTSSNGTVTADVYVRVYRWSPAGIYTLIATATAAGSSITIGGVTIAVPAIAGLLMDFGVGERLYMDVILNITANGSADPNATTAITENGGATGFLMSPGYDTTPVAEALTVLDVCKRAGELLGFLYPGQPLSPEDSALLLFHLNGMFDDWNADRLCLYKVAPILLVLVASQYDYTIGTGATDFNQIRPTLIKSGSVVIGGLDHPIEIWNSDQWAAKPEKGGNARKLPQGVYCDYDWPIAHLYVDPPPECATSTVLRLFVWSPLPVYSAVTDSFSLPPSYLMAVVSNLAVRSAEAFGKVPGPTTIQLATDTKARMRAQNAVQLQGSLSPESTGQVPTQQVPALQAPQQ